MGIRSSARRLIINILPEGIKSEIRRPLLNEIQHNQLYQNISYSQEGEDLVLDRLIGTKAGGFYVDIGAHHPMRFSNTYKFYLLGWRGINIDPLPNSMALFNKFRVRDINLEIPILNDISKEVNYYMFDEPALNTFDEALARKRVEETSYKIIEKTSLQPYKLSNILEIHLPPFQKIDFFSIDVEGMDLEVIKSNNWKRFRPNFIIAENFSTNLEDDISSEISRYLKEKEYILVSKTANSLIYSKIL